MPDDRLWWQQHDIARAVLNRRDAHATTTHIKIRIDPIVSCSLLAILLGLLLLLLARLLTLED